MNAFIYSFAYVCAYVYIRVHTYVRIHATSGVKCFLFLCEIRFFFIRRNINESQSEAPAVGITYLRLPFSPFCQRTCKSSLSTLIETLSRLLKAKGDPRGKRERREEHVLLLFQFVINSSRATFKYIEFRDRSNVFHLLPLLRARFQGEIWSKWPRLSTRWAIDTLHSPVAPLHSIQRLTILTHWLTLAWHIREALQKLFLAEKFP